MPRFLLLAALCVSIVATAARAETAGQADAFVDSIGVQTHLGEAGNYQSLFSTIVTRFETSGIRHIRDGCYPGTQSTCSTPMQNLMTQVKNATGVQIKFLLTEIANCSAPFDTPSKWVTWGWTANQIDGFEGMNEIGPNPGGYCAASTNPTWYQMFAQDAQYMHNQTIALPSPFNALPTVAATLNEFGRYNSTNLTSDSNQIGNISSFIDYGNWHVYCGNQKPSCTNSLFPSSFASAFGTKPYMVTETGYASWDATEAQAGDYYSRLFFSWWNNGSTRAYAYELLDDTGASDNSIGILHSDGSPKPAFNIISNVISILSDPGGTFTPGALTFSLSGGDSTLSHTLLQKRNGTFYLALWLDHNYGDSFANPQTVAVALSGGTYNVNVYDPNISSSVQSTQTSVTSVNVAVPNHTVILAITPTASASLTSSSASIIQYETATLTWSSNGAASCTGTNFSTGTGSPTSGTATVTPNTTTTYTVTCGTSTASVTVTVTPAQTTVCPASIQTGGPGAAPYVADAGFNRGTANQSTTAAINITSDPNPAPQAVYQYQRYGPNFFYVCTGLTPSTNYTVNLKFMEHVDTAGQRPFNVDINGTRVLSAFDIATAAGGQLIGIQRQFTVAANANGQIQIFFTGTPSAADPNARIDGIQVVPSSAPTANLSANPINVATPGNTTVLTWSSANAASCTGTNFSTGTGSPTSGTAVVAVSATTTYTVTCGTATASVTVTVGGTSGIASVNAGGGAFGNFVADTDFSGGTTSNNWNGAVDTSLITGTVPPVNIFFTERYGNNFNYTFPGLVPGNPYQVNLWFTEDAPGDTTAGARVFNVKINGNPALTNFDIMAAAGAQHKAIERTFNASADANGNMVVTFIGGTSPDPNAKVDAIEVVNPPNVNISGQCQ